MLKWKAKQLFQEEKQIIYSGTIRFWHKEIDNDDTMMKLSVSFTYKAEIHKVCSSQGY